MEVDSGNATVESSAVAQHVIKNGHHIEKDSLKIVKAINFQLSLYISKHENLMNRKAAILGNSFLFKTL